MVITDAEVGSLRAALAAAEAKAASMVSRDTMGGILAKLQEAQSRTVDLLTTERAANLYTADEAHAILHGFIAAGVFADPAIAAARASIVAAMQVQQPDVFAVYAEALG